MRRAAQLELTDDERTQFCQWARGRRTPVRLVLRAKVILLAAEGHARTRISPQPWGLVDRPWGSGDSASSRTGWRGLSATPRGAGARPRIGRR